ncbi:MAG: sulfatase-like hydrolase/transferase [Candidatus Azotimanducaceae bacterium]
MDIDTLRADHLGCYGYQRNTSPNIDEFAKSAMMFNNVHASHTPCLMGNIKKRMMKFRCQDCL